MEYLSKIQKTLKPRSLVDQVKDTLNQNEGITDKKKEFGKIYSQIC